MLYSDIDTCIKCDESTHYLLEGKCCQHGFVGENCDTDYTATNCS